MKKYLGILLFISISALAQKNSLKNEKLFHTKISHRWHKILKDEYKLNPSYDFIILGFEKINNHSISSNRKFEEKIKQEIFGVNVTDTLYDLKMFSQAKGNSNLIDDRKSLVLTHWLSRFDTNQTVNYSIYSKDFEKDKPYNIYTDSKQEFDNLQKYIAAKLSQKAYTHIILMSTGWNTNQKRSVTRYNQWSCSLGNMSKDSTFRPMYIGLTWPSNWFTHVFVDNVNKNRDADELGLISINYLIWKVLKPLTEEKKIPLIILGHSFGAKILTRASHSSIYFVAPYKIKSQIDLMINFEGAYRIIRHSTTCWPKRTINGGLYTLSNPWKKFIITASKHDIPLKLARVFGVYTGNPRSLKFVKKNPEFETNFVDTSGLLCNKGKGKRFVILDCRNIIWTHNDVSHDASANLIWYYMKEIK